MAKTSIPSSLRPYADRHNEVDPTRATVSGALTTEEIER